MKYLVLILTFTGLLHAHATFSTNAVVQPSAAMKYYFTDKKTAVFKKSVIISKDQHKKAQELVKTKIDGRIHRFYIAVLDGKVVGYGGLVTTTIRTKSATVLVVMDEKGKTKAIEVLAFFEPASYNPTEKWLNSFNDKTIHDELKLNESVPVISGSTLTAQKLLEATKTVFAVWEVYFNQGK